MARLRYVDKETASPEVADTFRKIDVNGARVLNLFKMVGHSQAALLPFIRLGNSLLRKAKLDAKLREIAILRVSQLGGADYEYQQHVVVARRAGLTEEQISGVSKWEESGAFDDKEKAVLAYTDEVIKGGKVRDDTFARLASFLNETEIVELTLSIGYWGGLVARFLTALQVDLEDPATGGEAVHQ